MLLARRLLPDPGVGDVKRKPGAVGKEGRISAVSTAARRTPRQTGSQNGNSLNGVYSTSTA